MAQVLIRDLSEKTIEKLKEQATRHGRSLQAELKTILETQSQQASKAEARALAARIRRQIPAGPQTDSGDLQSEDRQR